MSAAIPPVDGRSPERPFPDMVPTMEWQVAGHCNYDCSYCIQSKKYRQGQPEEALAAAIIRGFAGLPGAWEIKMSGGEPFAARLFLSDVVPRLVRETPHTISVLTNFSAPPKSLERFCAMTGERLRITSASLHLETVSAADFIDKALIYKELRARHNPGSSFVINSVLVPGTLRDLVAVKELAERQGFRWFPQLMKTKAGVFEYGPEERALVEVLTGGSHDPRVANRAPSYRGLHCEAGAWYLVVDQRGDVYSCRTAKRGREGFLGNLADGTFARLARGSACPYAICPCTVPANRGMIRFPVGWREDATVPAVGLDG